VSETAATTQTLALRDGRRLGYAQWGAGDGDPILYLHGGLGSRLERQRDDETYRSLGVHLVTVDRPGHGLSSSHEGRTPHDFADDLVELLNHLGFGPVAALGHSAGGLYVLALAHRHPALVRVAGVVSGIGIIDRPGGMEGLVPRIRRTYRNAREQPPLARAEMRINVAAFRYRPAFAFKQLSDRKVTSNPDFQRRFREALLEGARQGVRGFVSDIAVDTGPWGFNPTDIQVPVRWFHGDKDSASPLGHAQYVIDILPDAELTVVDGGGHFMIHTIIEDVISALAPSPSAG
jgi:pimeloyl-ACP methyl ester carboxylesterase